MCVKMIVPLLILFIVIFTIILVCIALRNKKIKNIPLKPPIVDNKVGPIRFSVRDARNALPKDNELPAIAYNYNFSTNLFDFTNWMESSEALGETCKHLRKHLAFLNAQNNWSTTMIHCMAIVESFILKINEKLQEAKDLENKKNI